MPQRTHTRTHTQIKHKHAYTHSLDQDQMARDLDAAVEEMVKEGWDEDVARNVRIVQGNVRKQTNI